MAALDHRLLRQFLAVAEEGTVRAAAARLHMTQPPLTAALRTLEGRLGVALFERSAKGMRLTAAGEVLAADARRVLGALVRAEERVRGAAAGRTLRVGFVSAALGQALPALTRALVERGTPPRLHEMTTPQQVAALEGGTLDVGLLHPPIPRLADFAVRSLGVERYGVALPEEHPLAERGAVPFAAVAAGPFVLFPETQGPTLYGRIRERVTVAGVPFQVAAEAARVHSQLAMVAGGLGFAFIAEGMAATLRVRGVATVALTDAPELAVELALVAEPDVLAALPWGGAAS